MSLLKYQDDPSVTTGNGRGPLFFGRAHLDGMPFRGQPPMLREDEFTEYCEAVCDAHVDTFDTSDPKQKRALEVILDRASNSWYRVLYMNRKWITDKDGRPAMLVYIEWVIPQLELNKHRLPNRSMVG